MYPLVIIYKGVYLCLTVCKIGTSIHRDIRTGLSERQCVMRGGYFICVFRRSTMCCIYKVSVDEKKVGSDLVVVICQRGCIDVLFGFLCV